MQNYDIFIREGFLVYIVEVDEEKCEGCGECAESCPAGMFELEDGKAKVTGDPEDCLGCETCTSVCSTGAVTLTEQ